MGVTPNLQLPFPELTDVMDGPDGFSDLARAIEDYVYSRIRPAGVNHAPGHFWGSGATYPAGPIPGDSFYHTAYGLSWWDGTSWQNLGLYTANANTIARRDASGNIRFNRVFSDYSTPSLADELVRKDYADQRVTNAAKWTITGTSDNTYLYNPPSEGQWYDLPGMLQWVTVPAGRYLEVEFDAPIGRADTFLHTRLLIDGVPEHSVSISAAWAPVHLSGDFNGDGRTVSYQVQVWQQGGAPGAVDLRASPMGVLRLRHRIW